jgi:AcrR family transcriptional regulator
LQGERSFVYLRFMPRKRTIPDERVFATIQRLLDEGGDKAVSFATIGAATGLAPPTLVQRYGSRDGMVRAARLVAWERLANATVEAIAATETKGPHALLKALTDAGPSSLVADFRDPDLAQRAAAWRATVESALALRLGSGQKGRESAALLFAAWQGQLLWSQAGQPGFKLKDIAKRLT